MIRITFHFFAREITREFNTVESATECMAMLQENRVEFATTYP
jgi:hypothetical protein